MSRSQSLPRFGAGADVELTKEEKREQKAVRNKEFVDISLSRRPGKLASALDHRPDEYGFLLERVIS